MKVFEDIYMHIHIHNLRQSIFAVYLNNSVATAFEPSSGSQKNKSKYLLSEVMVEDFHLLRMKTFTLYKNLPPSLDFQNRILFKAVYGSPFMPVSAPPDHFIIILSRVMMIERVSDDVCKG